ncbi:serine hydrolase [Kribbella sp. NPDC051770]|uniref:serine hydrolase domain-containing protein n=1 Tax=Kribbella sp. NPDC051770 TaxID=3155413 RepID=UPI003442A666
MRPTGHADEKFGAVADAFARNFEDFPELGAAVAVYSGGRKVVDLYAGTADLTTGRAWTSETVVPVFSCAKALVSISIHLLAQEGRLDLDAPVATYWPEFGKETITSRMVLGHRAGLPVLDRTLTFDEIAAWTPVVRAIEEQEPLWAPGTTYEYHGHVFGFLLGEVIRRITGLTPGRYFRQAIGDPLGLRAWIGVPPDEPVARLTEAEGRPPMPGPEHLLTRIVTMNGALVFPGLDEPHGWNDPDLLTIELPGAGAVASADSLAALFAATITGLSPARSGVSPAGTGVNPAGAIPGGAGVNPAGAIPGGAGASPADTIPGAAGASPADTIPAAAGVRPAGVIPAAADVSPASVIPGRSTSGPLLSPATITDALTEQSSGPSYLGFDAGARWGFLLDSAFRPMLGPRSFGNDGAGGQFAFADDEHGLAFAYVSNRMIGHGDARAANLIAALKGC